jgi:hypothetical protein
MRGNDFNAEDLLDDMKDSGLSMCSPSTRGIWFDLLCVLHELGRSGQVTYTPDQFCRVCRCTPAEFVAAIAELRTTQVAETHDRDGNVTVISKRMQIKHKQRVLAAERVRRHRCNAPVTPEKRPSNADVTNDEKDGAYTCIPNTEGEPLEEKKNSIGAKKGKPKPVDPRGKHPAILAVKSVTSRYPKKGLWDEVIRFLGELPDTEKMQGCYVEWIKRGYNEMNLAWLFDWTVTGIPEKGGFKTNGQTQTGKNGLNGPAQNGARRTTEDDGINDCPQF